MSNDSSMPRHIIRNRWTGAVIFEVEAESLRSAVGNANLSDANLSDANLSGANLSGANLSDADLSDANLSDADLSWANLSRANLSGANLSWANLIRANLSGADLIRANLSGADLSGADLSDADLSGADLSGADLSRANLSRADLKAIRADFFDVLVSAPREVPALRNALVSGQIDGSTYQGDCACLVGTIANARSCDAFDMPDLKPDSYRPAEMWFLAIRKGDTPTTNPVAMITLDWIDKFLAAIQPEESKS